jgi:CRISPR-associated protein Csb2
MRALVVTIRFLDPTFHGKISDDTVEWPPSPLRLFQALIAAESRRSVDVEWSADSTRLFEWLESLSAPEILAPTVLEGQPFRIAVPNNDLDVVAADWAKSRPPKKEPNELKTMKPMTQQWMRDPTLHYVWQLAEQSAAASVFLPALRASARHLVALGWGMDLAIADATIMEMAEVKKLDGIRWTPVAAKAEGGLRVPIPGTLNDVARRYRQFLARMEGQQFAQPDQLETFESVDYRRATDIASPPIAAFALLKPDASGLRAFESASRGIAVAGMTRFAMKLAADNAGWTTRRVNQFVLGHGEDPGQPHVAVGTQRFKYLPLPSVERRNGTVVVGAVRRLIVTCESSESAAEVQWSVRSLGGQELIDDRSGVAAALLSPLPTNDPNLQAYCRNGATWTTVTPVILPGFDDPSHYRRRIQKGVTADEQHRLLEKLHVRADGLIRKALQQAGFSGELINNSELEWRDEAFWPGPELASRFTIPAHLRDRPRLHVRVQWRDRSGMPLEVPGPICIGAGRFFGLGLFAAMD